MLLTVKLFATYRDLVGSREIRVRLGNSATLQDLLARLFSEHPRLKTFEGTMIVAVNHEFAAPDDRIREGDEIAIMPPVSGGATGGFVDIATKAIDVPAVLDSVRRRDGGAVVLFLGTVRSDPGVRALDYEVYRPMAVKKLGEIVERAKSRFGRGVLEASVVHRVGRVPVGRPSVAVAVSAPHRAEAFAAAAWIMDAVKKLVPIWKTER